MSDIAISIRSDFLDVNVQAYLYNLACVATRRLCVSSDRSGAGFRRGIVYSTLCSMARTSAKTSL